MSVSIESSSETQHQPSPIQQALEREPQGTPRYNTLRILTNQQALEDFTKLGGEISVALHGGELTYTDPFEKVLDSPDPSNPAETSDTDAVESLSANDDTVLLDYSKFIADRRAYAENQAKHDFGDPDDPRLSVTPEQRGEITRVIDAKVKEYLYQNFDEEFSSVVALVSRKKPIKIQMGPDDIFVAMEQEHMWLNRIREYVGYTKQENKIEFVLKYPVNTPQEQTDYAI